MALIRVIVLLSVMTVTPWRAAAQYGWTDGPFLNIPTVNVTSKKVVYQNNWCALRNAVLNGSKTIDNALVGTTVYLAFNPKLTGGWNVAANDAALWYQIKVDPKFGPVSGLMPEIWSALAVRLGFKVQWVYVPYKGSTATYPIYMNAITDSWGGGTLVDLGTRRATNVDYTDYYIFGNYALFGTSTTSSTSKVWNFLVPFSPILWVALLCLLLFNGAILQFFNPPESEDTLTFSCLRSLNAFSGDKVNVSTSLRCDAFNV